MSAVCHDGLSVCGVSDLALVAYWYLFELQDLPCVNQADVDIIKRQAWVSHTSMISPEDIAAALERAGYTSKHLES